MLLDLQNVTKSYPGHEGGQAVTVLRELNLQVPAGETVALVGPSGSGKSTLLDVLAAFSPVQSGKVLVAGQAVHKLSPAEAARHRCQTVGAVFQLHHLLPQCNVLENVLVPTLAADSPARGQVAKERALQLLGRVGMMHRVTHFPHQLSGGERQRVAVARALVNQPKILLADEPTGALDRHSAERLVGLLQELNEKQGITILMATHATSLARRFRRVLELRDGQLRPLGELEAAPQGT